MAKTTKNVTKKALQQKNISSSKKKKEPVKKKTENQKKKVAPIIKERQIKKVPQKNQEQTVSKPLQSKKESIKVLEEEVLKSSWNQSKWCSTTFRVLGSVLIFVGSILIGVMLYKPIVTTASGGKDYDCTYGSWVEEEVSYCLVSPDGKYFQNDRVMYIYNEKTGMCVKKTRTKTCDYKEV